MTVKRIVFIDDDANLLAGLQNQLRRRRREWSMIFTGSADAALEAMREGPCDILVTDLLMPGTDGLSLLRQASDEFPDTIRIVLSGSSECVPMVQAMAVAHQYLGKPVSPTLLQAVLEQIFRVRDLVPTHLLRAAIGRAVRLPAAPRIYTVVSRALQETSVSIRDVALLIEQDVAISAKVLQVANSGLFGLSQPLLSIERAVQYLGLVTIQNLVLTTEIFASTGADPAVIDAMHRHAALAGRLARRLAPEGMQGQVAYTAAMLHDIGQLLLSIAPGGTAAPASDERILCQSEQARYGITHAEVGAYFLGVWGFPWDIVEAVAAHHRGVEDRKGLDAAAAVRLTELLLQEQLGASAPSLEEQAEALGMASQIPAWRALAEEMAMPRGGTR
jgi:HD-like signal output (HDOD) protein